MYGKVLVTASLLDSFAFALSAPPTWKQRASRGFIQQIRREPQEYPSWVSAGEDFENAVYKVCSRSETLEEALSFGSDKFSEVVKHCYGGNFQNKLYRTITIDQHKCYFYGKTDVDFPTVTKDIKTCVSWKGSSKYMGKIQHKLYLWMNGKPKFEYIVVHWKNHERTPGVIKDTHKIDFVNPGVDVLEKEIVRRTQSMFDYIRAQGLWEDYYFTFSKN